MTEKRILTDDEQALFKQVAKVCGLELPTPSHYLTDDGPSPDILKDLADLGVEALGTYAPVTGDVTLYVVKCVQMAKKLNASPRDIELIVLAHEWAHMIQHRGLLSSGTAHWKGFPDCPADEIEDLAQKAAFMALHNFADGKELQDTLVRMADYQPARYKKFRDDYAGWLESGEPPNEELREVRRILREVRDASKLVSSETPYYDS